VAEITRKRMPIIPCSALKMKNHYKKSHWNGRILRISEDCRTMRLENKDRRILAELQRDSRLTMQELGERVGMSSSACWRRVRALEEAGVIDRYAVIANTRKAGFGLSSIVHVSLSRHEQKNVDNFVREVLRHPEILECFATSGEADFHLRVVVEDIDAYNAFLDNFIFRLPGVSQVRSNIVLKEIKTDTALPFDKE
jgi:Lrp/AsnC family leucine-responsive transcriptional regulator